MSQSGLTFTQGGLQWQPVVYLTCWVWNESHHFILVMVQLYVCTCKVYFTALTPDFFKHLSIYFQTVVRLYLTRTRSNTQLVIYQLLQYWKFKSPLNPEWGLWGYINNLLCSWREIVPSQFLRGIFSAIKNVKSVVLLWSSLILNNMFLSPLYNLKCRSKPIHLAYTVHILQNSLYLDI